MSLVRSSTSFYHTVRYQSRNDRCLVRTRRGNATDLSLLPTMSYADIQALQASQAGADAMDKILRNDLERAWERVRALRGERVDLVLDNGGCLDSCVVLL